MAKRLPPQDVQMHIRVSKIMKARLDAEEARTGISHTDIARMAMAIGLDAMGIFNPKEKP